VVVIMNTVDFYWCVVADRMQCRFTVPQTEKHVHHKHAFFLAN